jgi:hypothetical protein
MPDVRTRTGEGSSRSPWNTLAAGSSARAHQDPNGCSRPARRSSSRSAGTVRPRSAPCRKCETINYRARPPRRPIRYGSLAEVIFALTTPDGVVHTVSPDVPCIGGNSGLEGAIQPSTSRQRPDPIHRSAGDRRWGRPRPPATRRRLARRRPELAGRCSETPKSTPVVFARRPALHDRRLRSGAIGAGGVLESPGRLR